MSLAQSWHRGCIESGQCIHPGGLELRPRHRRSDDQRGGERNHVPSRAGSAGKHGPGMDRVAQQGFGGRVSCRVAAGRAIDLHLWQLHPGPGRYLVVAADLETFHARHPDVSNAIGNWNGSLGNNGDTFELLDAQGNRIQPHRLCQRRTGRDNCAPGRAPGGQPGPNGQTVSAYIFGHDFNNNDWIKFPGTDQPEFNGVYRITLTASAPSITL